MNNMDLVDLYTRALQREGYHVKTASTKSELITLYRTNNFDAAVIDLMKPNSLEIITELNAIPILAISGNPSKESLALEHGANYFLLRPFKNGIQDLGLGIIKSMARKARDKYNLVV